MATFKTKNGVKVTFDNNFIDHVGDISTPLLVFNDDELKEINFNGFYIVEKKNHPLQKFAKTLREKAKKCSDYNDAEFMRGVIYEELADMIENELSV